MTISIRKSWWWLTPLAVILVGVGLFAPRFITHARMKRIAQRIVERGGCVKVRNDAPKWLLRLVSDGSRERFPREMTGVPSLGPNWLRNGIKLVGFDSLLMSWDVADSVEICVGAPVRSVEVGSDATDLSEILAATSRLPTLSDLRIICRTDCQLDLSDLAGLPSLESLTIDARGPDDYDILTKQHLRDSFAPNELRWPPVGVTVKGIGSLKNLHRLTLSGFDDRALELLNDCRSLRELSLYASVVTEDCLPGILKMSHLETLHLGWGIFPGSTLDALKSLTSIRSLWLRVRNANYATVKAILSRVPAACLRRLSQECFALRFRRENMPLPFHWSDR